MNFWIVGGLLAVGLLSILGLVVVVTGEQKQQARHSSPKEPTRVEQNNGNEDGLNLIGGELRELSHELGAMRQQTQQLEQRLLRLVEQPQSEES